MLACFQANDGVLDCLSFAITCEFNRPGTLLAVGCNDGRVEIWDFLTRGCAKFIMAHVHPVCSLRCVFPTSLSLDCVQTDCVLVQEMVRIGFDSAFVNV